MSINQTISAAIREALDARGVEIPWSDTDAAATRVEEVLEDILDDAWRYREVSK